MQMAAIKNIGRAKPLLASLRTGRRYMHIHHEAITEMTISVGATRRAKEDGRSPSDIYTLTRQSGNIKYDANSERTINMPLTAITARTG